ncbi:gliding motility-associated C-terminal domain-containing protein [Emticicia oligotrophica]|uniref:T9SS type B sorting domain-containing protein n=1 Tax=Emticicia oligotrophica TaxID=312279 RepID=UPI00273B8F29|nr:gliding motility-associated C-terminal domain-containing protein [Emticicia oligotrophica]
MFAQDDLCTKAGVERGGFTFDGPSTACIGQEIKLRDNSGGTGVKYIFGYTPGLDINSTPSQTDTKYTFLAAGQYTVLQFGKKGGRDMYYCDVVYVRDNTQPKASYSTCNNQNVEVIIPKDDKINDYDYYNISWGDGGVPEVIAKNQLPYRKVRTLNLPRDIKIEGFFNGGTNCPSPGSITLPILTPSAFPSGYTQAFYPNINRLELLTAKTAKLEIKGSFQENGYDLFMTPQGTPYPTTPIQSNIKPGTMNITIPDTTKSYCFYIKRSISCGIEQSAEICTVVLNNVIPQESANIITWKEYPTEMTGISNNTSFGRYLNSSQKIQKKENGTLLPLINANGLGGTFQETVNCSKKYCYQVISDTQGQIYYNAFTGKSVSKQVCVDRKEIAATPITESLVTVKENNQVEININDNSPWTLQRKEYIFYRVENGGLTSINSGTLNKQFIDATIDASTQSFCYKVGFKDECGSTSTPSPSLCTINLKQTIGRDLEWTNNSPFGATAIDKFYVQFFDEQTNILNTETIKNANETTFSPNLDNFEVVAKYRIKATSSNGKESFSNIFSIPINVSIFLPDAFTPNGDGKNDELLVKGNTRRIINFEFQIFNRWGNPVFTTSNATESWDGKYQNVNAPIDNYSFKIYAKLDDGKELIKSGQFLLIR